jgi:hypothetical protein
MSITSERWDIEHLRRIARFTAAGLTSAQVAQQLNDTGVPVPRESVTHYALYRYDHGGALPTDASNPSRWTAPAVDAVKACPEYSATNNYAAARAKLGSDATTTLTIT